jgi:hypothetical protein
LLALDQIYKKKLLDSLKVKRIRQGYDVTFLAVSALILFCLNAFNRF